MEKIEHLPLGSIVVIRGGVKKSMIIARAIAVNVGDVERYFDYAGCLYPEGLMGDQLIYFNHEDIQKLIFKGFEDDDNEIMLENINRWIETSGYEKGQPLEINKKNAGKA